MKTEQEIQQLEFNLEQCQVISPAIKLLYPEFIGDKAKITTLESLRKESTIIIEPLTCDYFSEYSDDALLEIANNYGLSQKYLKVVHMTLNWWTATLLGTEENALALKPRFHSKDFNGLDYVFNKLAKKENPVKDEIFNYKFKNLPMCFMIHGLKRYIRFGAGNYEMMQEVLKLEKEYKEMYNLPIDLII